MLDALNESLFEHSTSGMFVTLLYVVVDSAARTLSYGSAGHLPMIRKMSGASSVELLDQATGIPLGVTRGARYTMHTSALEKGDLLFLYTDGIIEARNRKGDEFGLARLKRLLSTERAAGPEGVVKRVLRRVERFARGMPQYDDLTALAIKIG
jgi:sigma-B regulation protein RsbU (phosphoserine phosphatase)